MEIDWRIQNCPTFECDILDKNCYKLETTIKINGGYNTNTQGWDSNIYMITGEYGRYILGSDGVPNGTKFFLLPVFPLDNTKIYRIYIYIPVFAGYFRLAAMNNVLFPGFGPVNNNPSAGYTAITIGRDSYSGTDLRTFGAEVTAYRTLYNNENCWHVFQNLTLYNNQS